MERLSRQQQQRRTRERLLDAAARLFSERGLGASLDDIAASAGMTKGAVYSNFANKEALVLALIERRIQQQRCESNADALIDSMATATNHRDLGDAYQESIESQGTRDFALLLMDFWVAAMRNARMRSAYVQVMHELRRGSEDAILRTVPQDRLQAPVQDLAAILIAVDMGLAIQHLLEPEADTGRRYALAVELLGGPLMRDRAARQSPGPEPAGDQTDT